MAHLLDHTGAPVIRADAPVKVPGTSRYASGYMRGGRSVALAAWQPALREAQDDIAAAWEKAAARANDAIINSGWLSGAIEQCVANTVGTGLRLKVQPENELFGMSNKAAQAWAKKVEQRFGLWADNPLECDLRGKQTLGQMQASAFRGWIGTGEMLAANVWRPGRVGCQYGTKIQVLPAHRLSRETNALRRLFAGVFVDGDDMPVAYRIRRRTALGTWEDMDVRARDSLGRQLVGHFFEGILGAHRGIGPLAPILQVIRQYDDMSDATLAAMVLKTLFAATIESELPTPEALTGLLGDAEMARIQRDAHISGGETPFEAWLDLAMGYHEGSHIDVGRSGRVAHLFPGEKFEMKTANAPGSDYKDFSGDLKREMARALGMTYESFTGDYNGATYNSMSYGTTEIFEVTKVRRSNIVAPFCQMAYEAWLEEEILERGLEFPGGPEAFLANRAAASRALWIGAPKPMADILKAAKAYETLDRMAVIPQRTVSEAFGMDIEDVYHARQQEAEMRKLYQLPEPSHMGAQGGAPKPPPGGDSNDDEDDGDDA